MSIFGMIRRGARIASRFCVKHSPQILTGLGIGGSVGAVVLAIKATPKATYTMDRLHKEYEGDIPKSEIVKEVGRIYIPTIITLMASSACMIGATSVSLKRNAVLASLYSASEIAAKEYHDKVVEVIGEKKDTEIRDKISQDHIDRTPVQNKEVIIATKDDDHLCFDEYSKRYFRSNIHQLNKIRDYINRTIVNEMWVTLNQLYIDMGLDPVGYGDEIGWNCDGDIFEFYFGTAMNDDLQEPCITVRFREKPYNYKERPRIY